MSYRCHIEPNAGLRCVPSQRTLCKVCSVVCDDTVRYPVPHCYIHNELDCCWSVQLLDRPCFDPLGERVHCHQEMCHATSGCLERSDHVQSPCRKWPYDRYGLE